MGDDAEYEMARHEEERRMEEMRGPRNSHELFEKVRSQISYAKKIY